MHNEFLVLSKGEKMAKSGDNFLTLSVLEDKGYSPLDYRYFCLGTHYRNPLMFSFKALDSARIARKKLFDRVLSLKGSKHTKDHKTGRKYAKQFTAEINDDLNTPKALAVMWDVLKSDLSDHVKYLLLLEFDKVLGFNLGSLKKVEVPESVTKLAEERLVARNAKDWKKSDKLRSKIEKLGYSIADTKDGYEVKKD